MKKIVSVTLSEETLRLLASDILAKNLSRSAIVRIALSEYYERREKTEKENQNKE